MKGLSVTKIVNEVKFEGVLGELEAKKLFQRQTFSKDLRQTLVCMRKREIRESFNFYFPAVVF